MTKNSDICRVLYACLPDNHIKRNHLRDKHPEYEADYVAYTGSLATSLHSFGFVSDKIANINHWMEWVVDRNMPLLEKVIVVNIPTEFGIMFDGWQCLSEHYVALTAMYWCNDEMHYDLLAGSLKFLVGDNCATNQLMATILGVPLVGCVSLSFNLASNQFLIEHEDLATAVAALMTALRTVKNREELRRHTQLAPLRANVTRWSSPFTMLERYVRIQDAIKRVDAVYDLIPKPAMHRRFVAPYETLKRLTASMAEMYPVTTAYLSPDANIIHSPSFECAVVKVAGNREGELTEAAMEALEPLTAPTATEDATPTDCRVGPRTRAQHGGEDFATTLLLSDSIPCKLVMTPQRSSLLPVHFETIEFLRVNQKYWDASTLMDANVEGEDE
ncbi:hypothetical protein PHMEG_0007417 [Phytophthora megakarya]|uniref:Uncharacterized protein n=1 Tax=Phytophthora megakarya TaxID=4795 RepID=A0A225WL90_9STRA|nr:hypothetical protein PHMEG_0007417 [Phytophthora megakarya]